jgi:hypothetical protein
MKPEWRGVIENVDSGERIYFIDLSQVTKYLTLHLETMGIDMNSS